MQISPSFVILLLIGYRLPGSLTCTVDRSRSRCTCSFAALKNFQDLIDCLGAFVFEFRDGKFEDVSDIHLYYSNLQLVAPYLQLPIDKIILGNSVLDENFLRIFLDLTRNVNIRELVFEDCTFTGRADWQLMEGKVPKIVSLQFINVSSASLTDRGKDFSHISSWMARMKNIVLTRSQTTHIPHSISMHFKDLHALDLSENQLQDQGINDSFSDDLFQNLKSLKLRHNNLTSFDVACKALSKLPNLQDSDLSQNNFSKPPSSPCEWPQSIYLLNLSNTCLEHVNTHLLPPSIELLDLSDNKLSALDVPLPHLKEVYLPNNRLHSLPSSNNLPELKVLILDGNRITGLPKDQLQAFKHLSVLKADRNPYTCSCAVVNEMKELSKSSFVVQQWPEGYLCDSPSVYKGHQVKETDTVFECYKPLFIVIICAVIVLVCIVAAICWVRNRCFTQPRA
ncbi:monocyte differentiation antigen CD14 [Microcaecilia unicolor]|uniref:Monocyte differentiation antigen CD14 n=1 Tax=Microcaecilia unicolor TaxID=1415580 RepID=A0A6P7YWS1_9AMPH|nr:toll-like receptor 2 [Microcaecilia unicolor]